MIFSFAEMKGSTKGEPKKESETYLDLYTAKNVRVKERVLSSCEAIPSGKQLHAVWVLYVQRKDLFLVNTSSQCSSKFNFVGKILGPQGSTIKRLQEDTGAKISVLGKGSMRDKNKVMNQAVMLLGVRLSDLVTKD